MLSITIESFAKYSTFVSGEFGEDFADLLDFTPVVSDKTVIESDVFKKVLEKPLLINNPLILIKNINLMYNLVFNCFFVTVVIIKKVKRIFKTTYFLFDNRISRVSKITFALFFFLSIPFLTLAQSKNVSPKIKRVVIDAGHGGKDPGAVGAEIKEKDVCLAVSLMVGKLIQNYFNDVDVFYTRDKDVFVKLFERAEYANKHKADLFISIHVNAAQNPAASGTETFVMGTKYSDTNREIAKRENSVIFLEDDYEKNYDQNLLEFDPNSPMADILAGLIQQEYQGQSIEFATLVENQFSNRQKRKSRGVKQRVLLVMYRTAMPSVLVELGFISNKEEHDILKTNEGMIDHAGSIFRAFVQYKREMEGMPKKEIAAEEKKIFENWETYKKLLQEDKKIPLNLIAPKSTVPENKEEELKQNIEKITDNSSGSDVIFKVQISSSDKLITINSRNFNGLDNISYYKDGGSYKYTYGECASFACAQELQNKAKNVGYTDSFVIAFYKGERVSMQKAKEILSDK